MPRVPIPITAVNEQNISDHSNILYKFDTNLQFYNKNILKSIHVRFWYLFIISISNYILQYIIYPLYNLGLGWVGDAQHTPYIYPLSIFKKNFGCKS